MRTPQASFERWAAEILDRSELAERAAELDGLAADWRAVAEAAQPTGASGSPGALTAAQRAEVLPVLAAQLERLAEREEASLATLRALLRMS